MTKEEFFAQLNEIDPADVKAMEKAADRQSRLAKPPGSLGVLEELSIKMAGITGQVKNTIEKTCVAVMCADNGVAEEGIASAPQSVTRAQTINFTRRLTGVGALAESFGSDLLIVDLGVKDDIPQELYCEAPLEDTHKIVNRRIRRGTWNIAKGPAMTFAEALQCIETGMEMASALKKAGYDLIGAGEMGIGNTTTSAAVLSALTDLGAEETCGRGGGVNDAGFSKKKEIVDTVSQPYRSMEFGEALDSLTDVRNATLEILATAGGFDICAMTGLYLGAARNRLPIVIDGYISAVAALAAYMMAPDCASCMFASHKSLEKGYLHAMDRLGLRPFLDLDMRLGEGSGCPIAFEVLRGACDVMCHMATFDEAEINDDYLDEIREGDFF